MKTTFFIDGPFSNVMCQYNTLFTCCPPLLLSYRTLNWNLCIRGSFKYLWSTVIVYVPLLVWCILLLFCRTRWVIYKYFSHLLILLNPSIRIQRLSSLVLLSRFSRCLHLLFIWSLQVSVTYCFRYWIKIECSRYRGFNHA